MTFSIVAYDDNRKEWGVAVQSKFLAVGAVVPWAKAGVGAIATQAYANMDYGSDGLRLLAEGKTAVQTLDILTAADAQREIRQCGVVDANGRAASFTGAECHDWAGHHVGENYCCQGNILIPGTVEAMASAFEAARARGGDLEQWLLEALVAGQAAGGDSRGRQSAAMLVVREHGSYGGYNDRYLDLRVDDDAYPIRKLGELLKIHRLFRGEVKADDLIPLDSIAAELQELVTRTGHYDGPLNGTFDTPTRDALRALVGVENLEDRWNGEGDVIDKVVVEFLNGRFPKEE